jgi:hypothetical protein
VKDGTRPGEPEPIEILPPPAELVEPVEPKQPTIVRPEPPSKDRRDVGRYVRLMASPSVLVSRTSPSEPWQRLKLDSKVASRDQFVSLPGYSSELRLDSGVTVTLRGSTFEFGSPFLESAVVLHAPAQGFDADLTLDRGAVLLTNRKEKEPASVRVRFQGEVWDVRLEEPGAEVGLTLHGTHIQPYAAGEGPYVDMHAFVLKRRASVRVSPFVEHENLQAGAVPTVLFWDNQGPGVKGPLPARDQVSQALLAAFNEPDRADLPPEAQQQVKDTLTALDEINKRLLGSPDRVETALVEMLRPEELLGGRSGELKGRLTVRCLGALDMIADLIDLLGGEQQSPALRVEAIGVLRHLIGRDEGQEARLFDRKTRSGALTDKRYTPTEAATIMVLLHPFDRQQLLQPETWAYLIERLKNEKLAIRELAYWHLWRLVPEGRTKIAYNPTGGPEQLEGAYKQWKKLIPDGELPPKLR